ncbi:hypothetical protein ACLMJK_005791 [Lecanora helva]
MSFEDEDENESGRLSLSILSLTDDSAREARSRSLRFLGEFFAGLILEELQEVTAGVRPNARHYFDQRRGESRGLLVKRPLPHVSTLSQSTKAYAPNVVRDTKSPDREGTQELIEDKDGLGTRQAVLGFVVEEKKVEGEIVRKGARYIYSKMKCLGGCED